MKRKRLPDHNSGPVRTCLACGKRFLKSDLLRFVADDGGIVVVDLKRCMPGRGVYCCPDSGCLSGFVKKRGKLLRALRITEIDRSSVFRLVEECRSDIVSYSN